MYQQNASKRTKLRQLFRLNIEFRDVVYRIAIDLRNRLFHSHERTYLSSIYARSNNICAIPNRASHHVSLTNHTSARVYSRLAESTISLTHLRDDAIQLRENVVSATPIVSLTHLILNLTIRLKKISIVTIA